MFELIVQIIAATGLAGVALLMFAENVFPPIPSELIMPLAGFAAARGDMSFLWVVLAGTGGAVAGALIWYLIGRRVGLARITRWSAGAVRLTLTSLPSWLPRAVADWDDEATFFQTPPFPTGCDPARGLAVFSVQPQPS